MNKIDDHTLNVIMLRNVFWGFGETITNKQDHLRKFKHRLTN